MDREDRRAIADLFGRLAEAERKSPPRDPEAEAFMRERIAAQPGAPYYLAQTVIVQQQALESARDRIAELESRAGGGFLGSLFGDNGRRQAPRQAQPMPDDRRGPWGGGGGFLAGAAQTAMGVAGGVLLGNMIGGLFGGSDAHAADSDRSDDGDAKVDSGASTGDSDGGSFDGGGFDGGD
jgi:hypothetical protein